MAVYKIGSRLGYDLASGMKPGDTITATDGSIWTKNQDGSLTVQHQGQTMQGQITYNPGSEQQRIPDNFGGQLQQQTAGMTGGKPYESPYGDQIKGAISDLQNAKWEGYDKEKDPSYQAYRKEFLREADRTAEDVLGRYEQSTGGIAGTAAITAASQAADYQKSQLADKIPQLSDAAFGRWMQGQGLQHQLLGSMMQAENQAQNEHYNQIQSALSKWAQMGYADQEVAGILGVTPGTPTSDQAYANWSEAFEKEKYDWQKQQALDKAAAKAARGTGGPSNKKDRDTATGSTGEPSSGYQTIKNMIVNTRNMTDTDYINLVQRAYDSGTINNEELERLLAERGL